MRAQLSFNPSFRLYAIWFLVLGFAGILPLVPMYSYAQSGEDISPLCGLNLLLGMITLGVAIYAIRVGRYLHDHRRLNRQIARFVAGEAVTINIVLIILATILMFSGASNVPLDVSNNLLRETVEGLLVILLLFYPLHLAVIGLGISSLIFIRRQSLDSFGSEYPSLAELQKDLALSESADEADAIIYPEVWISSVDHLDQAAAYFEATPEKKRARGQYNIPEGFPFARAQKNTNIPALMFARGFLKVGKREIVFRGINRPVWVAFLWQMRFFNLKNNYRFSYKSPQIKGIKWYSPPRSIADPNNNLPWIMVVTDDIDLLLMAGGFGSDNKQKVEARTKQLFSELRRLQNRNDGTNL